MTTSITGSVIRRVAWLQRAILVCDAVFCAVIAIASALAILGNMSLMVAPLKGFDGSPLAPSYLIAPAIALVAGLVAFCTSVQALRGVGMHRWLLIVAVTVICLLYVVEAAFHVSNLGRGGNLAHAGAVAGVSLLWWLLNLAFVREGEI